MVEGEVLVYQSIAPSFTILVVLSRECISIARILLGFGFSLFLLEKEFVGYCSLWPGPIFHDIDAS